MKLHVDFSVPSRKTGGFTMAELLVATLLFMMALASIMALLMYGLKSFHIMGNYVDLDIKSRNAVDSISREIRNSSALVSFTNNSTMKYLKLTNSTKGITDELTYNPTTKTLTLKISGQQPKTLLTECDQFDFSLYSRAPKLSSTNITFYGATNAAGVIDPYYCKLVNMSWRCSRKILGTTLTTESVQTAQIVLRNKVK